MLKALCGSFFVSFIISLVAIPVIIKVASLKHLMDEPDQERKFHGTRTPTLGGVAIFCGMLFSYSFFTEYTGAPGIKFLIPALILLFFAGIKDDILILSPVKKLLVQIFCAILVIFFGALRISSLWGIFQINEVSPLVGGVITLLLVVSLINAYNLIDGVDGLAGSLGLIACIFLGGWFALAGQETQAVLAFSLAGALLGFLFFNFRNAKIFMGDTGSMVLGFIIAVLAIKFIECNRALGMESSPYYIKAAPGVALSVMLIPWLDLCRVFFCRVIRKKSPFKADRSHIHHLLIDLGLGHMRTTITLIILCLSTIAFAFIIPVSRSLELALWLIFLQLSFTGVLVCLKRKRFKR